MQRRNVVVLLAMSVVWLSGAPAIPQAADTEVAPRTAWGAPDLQGVWDFRTLTPLQRPEEFEGRELLTDEEASAREGRALERTIDRAPPPGLRSPER